MSQLLTTRRAQNHISNPAQFAGISLVEILVSVAIGLFLVVGATTVYVNSKKNADVDDAVARLQETARYAMSVIENDVRMSNYWGLIKDAQFIENKLSQTGTDINTLVASTAALSCGNTHAIDLENYITGTNNSYGLSCAARYASAATADTLTIRRANTAVAASNANKLQICSTRSVANVIKGATCATGEIHDLVVHTYYVDAQSDIGTTIPSLRRKTLGVVTSPSAQPGFSDVEIIPGVEDIQIQFGWNPTAENAAVQYVNPQNAVLASGQIVAVRVWLLVRADVVDRSFTDTDTYTYADRTYTPADNYRRLLVSRTFYLRNVANES